MSNLFENFDSSLSLPATLSQSGAGAATVTANGSAISAPNVLILSTNGVQDIQLNSVGSFSANAVFSYWFKMTLASPVNLAQIVAFRIDGTGNYYYLRSQYGSGDLTPELVLIEGVNNVESTLATVGTGAAFAANEWYDVTISPVGTLIVMAVQRQSDSKWLTSSNTWQSSPTNCISVTGTNSVGGIFQFTLSATTGLGTQQMLMDNLSMQTGGLPVPQGPVVQSNGTRSTFTFDSGGASVSGTDYTKVILGGQATASAAITGLTVSTGTTSTETGTLTYSGLIVPGITITTNFSDGALTTSGGTNFATGALTGTNNSTTLDLIVDAGTLSGTTATITAAAVNAQSLIINAIIYNNNSSVGTFVTGSTFSPVTGGDLITVNGYLADNTLIASGTLFTVASLSKISSTQIKAVLSGPFVLTPGTNGFLTTTWRDTTAGVNTNGFSSQDTSSSGIWTFGSAFSVSDAWGFSAVPTYVMNMTGVILDSTPNVFSVSNQSMEGLLILGVL